MNTFKSLTFLAVASIVHVSCMVAETQNSEKHKPLSLRQSIVVGGLVGAAEVTFPGQPLSYAMNLAIKNSALVKSDQLPFVLTNSYQGFATNALGQMPITAVQKGIQAKGTEWIKASQNCELSDLQNAGVSYVAGIGGALIDTPSNAMQLYMQNAANAGKNMRQAFAELGKKSMRGFTANAVLKEGPFAVGYQMLAPKGTKLAEAYVGDNVAATVLGGVTAGVVTAVVTHPGAVIRNKMQGDLEGTAYPTMLKTASKICKEDGPRALFSGLKQRGARIAIAIPLYVAYSNALSERLFPESTR